VTLYYVTTNDGKVREARAYLDRIEPVDYDYAEIQAPTLEPIAARGAREAYEVVIGGADLKSAAEDAGRRDGVIVDDAGLFVEGIGGFPGPYSAFVDNTIGIESVGELARAELGERPRATFRCALAYCDGASLDDTTPDGSSPAHATMAIDEAHPAVAVFSGEIEGRIVEPRGDGGFGYDPIFEHQGRTLAEMGTGDKNAISHRGRALERFASWYDGQ
jgi:XTP/dITP diphosphohydrolase